VSDVHSGGGAADAPSVAGFAKVSGCLNPIGSLKNGCSEFSRLHGVAPPYPCLRRVNINRLQFE